MAEIAVSANNIAKDSKTSARLTCRLARRLQSRGGPEANRIIPNTVSEAWRAECVIYFALIEGALRVRGALKSAPHQCLIDFGGGC